MPKKKRSLTVEDLWQLQRLGTPSLAPDGRRAVVAVATPSMDDNKTTSALCLVSTTGDAPRALTTCGDKDGAPRWSPRGDRIAFVAKREQQGQRDAEPQLYLIGADGGEARRAAQVATGVEAFRWCPDGRRLVFVSWVWPELKGSRAQAKRHKAHAERKETGYATSEAMYRYWDRNLPQGREPHLYLLDTGSDGTDAKVRDLFEGTDYALTRADPGADGFDVSPDGRHAVFAFDPERDKRVDARYALAEIDLKTGATRVVVRDADWDFASPRYSPDGTRIAFTASHQALRHTMPAQLAVADRDGAGAWDVVSAEWDHEVRGPLLWEADGSAVLFTAEQRGRTHLWRFDLADRRAEVVVAGGWVSGFDKAAGTLVTVADSASHPARMHAHLPGAAPQRVESFNDALLDRLALGRVEEVWFHGAAAAAADGAAAVGEGDAVQMWLTYPADFDPKRRWPVLHNLHGGPHTGPGDNWHYRWNTQVFAAMGYVVAAVNYHGSSGFGHAFLDSITHRWGTLELRDIEAATDWLQARPWVAADRIFAAGGSYGGYLVAWLNGHVAPGRYRAYVCHAGCFDWVSMFADDAWGWHAKELGRWYWDDIAHVQAQSPHAVAARMRTPTLVIHGALDYRVPDAQGLAYYNTLKALGVDARLLWFPDENHWVLKPRNSRQWYREFADWLRRHDAAERPRRKRAERSRRG